MTPLDALKAGVKSAIVTFLLGLVVAFSGLVNEINDFASKGDPIDWSVGTATLVALAGALGVGILNALLRYIQVAAVPFLSTLIDKILGAVPAYPEAHKVKALTPVNTTVTNTRGDGGQITTSGMVLVVFIVCLVLAVLWAVGVNAPWIE